MDTRGRRIESLEGIQNLTSLERLHLGGNEVSDISALVANVGFGSGDSINMLNNYLDLEDQEIMDDINILINRGVNVSYDPQREPGESGTGIEYYEDKEPKLMEEMWEEKYWKEDF